MPVIVPILAFSAAYALIKSENAEPVKSDSPVDNDEPTGSDGYQPNPSPIDWQPLIEEMRGDIPADYLDRWIAKESGGNPCSEGAWGGPWEAGIGQVYFDRDQRYTQQFGVTLDKLRSCCSGDSQSMARQPNDDEMRIQMSSLIAMAYRYIGIAKSRAPEWQESDILCLAKLYHALPVLVTTHLSLAKQDGMADSWDSYRDYLGNMTRDEVLSLDQRAGYSAGRGAAPYWPLDRLFSNAQLTGRGY